MSDLISKQAAIKALCEKGMCGDKQCNAYPCEDVRALEQVPTIDPVKHGVWLQYPGEVVSDDGLWGETLFDCSNCGHTVHVATRFCSQCGARMERLKGDWKNE